MPSRSLAAAPAPCKRTSSSPTTADQPAAASEPAPTAVKAGDADADAAPLRDFTTTKAPESTFLGPGTIAIILGVLAIAVALGYHFLAAEEGAPPMASTIIEDVPAAAEEAMGEAAAGGGAAAADGAAA